MTKDSKFAQNKYLYLIPGAVHTDLYDNMTVIPFADIAKFYREFLR